MLEPNLQKSPPSYYPLNRETEFGALVAPLVESLRVMNPRDVETIDWLARALPEIRQFAECRNFASLTLVQDDLLYLMADPVGDQIRRVVTHKWLSDVATEALQSYADGISPADHKFLSFAIDIFYRSGYSQFVNRHVFATVDPSCSSGDLYLDARTSWADLATLGREVTLDGALAGKAILTGVCERTAALAASATNYRDFYSAGTYAFLTDLGHTTDNLATEMKMLFECGLERLGGKAELPRLLVPTSFMIIEDNPLHHMFFTDLSSVIGASFYGVDAGTSVSGAVPHYFLDADSAERAVTNALSVNGELPRVIICDIELGTRAHRTGLHLAESLDSLLRAAGRREEVELFMVYSSNSSLYQDQVADLLQRKIITGSTLKTEFSLKDLLERINGLN